MVLYGPRRAGKTFLIENILKTCSGKIFTGVGEDRDIQAVLESESVEKIKSLFSFYDIVFIDEAQQIRDVGTGLKLLVDHCKNTKLIATGSSSFELSEKVGEPLTGRKKQHILYPVSIKELSAQLGPMAIKQKLENLLIFGMYPEILEAESVEEKKELLIELRDSYLLRDILKFENLKNPRKLTQLLSLLAFQVGKEVSFTEIGQKLEMSKNTVSRYIELLEKSFVIQRISGYAKNLRNEITKSCRFYFLDIGIRNAVINNFNNLELRNDTGELWENFLFMERIKANHYSKRYLNTYFWRTYSGQEIDLVEDTADGLFAFEFKWSPKKKPKAPTAWAKHYPDAGYKIVHQNNFLEFCT